ncbi:hypothetical protein [Actinocorallia longicatena]|uniref:Uncharacterized protein n=1 Tax=Actinocorallia longicatena TaxID=111803 RepID=A0ABP6QI54_9ACTN
MDADTITAISATVIAVASLVVSIRQSGAARRHNRQSVRPHLQFQFKRNSAAVTGLHLANHGLGPAVIISSALTVDGRPLGPWTERNVNGLRDGLPRRPSAVTFHEAGGTILPVGYAEFLLGVRGYRPEEDAWFWELIRGRIALEIRYQSLYGDETYTVSVVPTSPPVPRGLEPAPLPPIEP